MKIAFDANGVLIVASHEVLDDPVVEIGRFPAGDVLAFEGSRARQIQLFEAVLDLLKSDHCFDHCLFLIGNKTVADNSPDLVEIAKEIQ